MRIGTKILLLMLLITVGSTAVITWIVTLSVTRYETERVNDQITQAISRYGRQLDHLHQSISGTVRTMMESPTLRSQLQVIDDPTGESYRQNLRQITFRVDLQGQLVSPDSPPPAFHVLLNPAHEVPVATAIIDPALESVLASGKVGFAVDAVLGADGAVANSVRQYITTPRGLFLAMGVPLHAQLDEPPSHAYFVGFKMDDAWVRSQLLAERPTTQFSGAPLCAWIVVDGKVVASASADPSDTRYRQFSAATRFQAAPGTRPSADSGPCRGEFAAAGEHFMGQSFNLDPANPGAGKLVLGSSLDQALRPLHRLQRLIFLTALGTCAVALVVCRFIASMIARPIGELVAGTQRIAAGRFNTPVPTGRRDELGKLAESFNQMSDGLKERDALREQQMKIERDLAVARKIQLDILPKEVPACPGYDLAAFSLPAEATGGDIYDLVHLVPELPNLSTPTNPPPLVLLLADATGHGIGPALSVTQVRSMIRIGVRLRAGLESIFSQINRQLCQDLGSGRFVTAFLGLLDPKNHLIDYHSAGQGPLLHFHAAIQHFEWLDCSVLPLGVDEDAKSDGVKSMAVAPGDLVVLLTDGFYEYQSPDNELFGRDRVAELVLRHGDRSARELLSEILNAIRQFGRGAPQLDDMTALIIRRLPRMAADSDESDREAGDAR